MTTKPRSTAAKAPSLRVVPPAPEHTSAHPPPSYLSPAMQDWWRSVLKDFELDRHHRLLLESACNSYDRMTEAREALAEHGLTFVDASGSPKARPEVAVERDARIALARLIRELDLDEAPPPEPRGRPPGIRSNRR